MNYYSLHPRRMFILKCSFIALFILLIGTKADSSSTELVQRQKGTIGQHDTSPNPYIASASNAFTKPMKVLLQHVPARRDMASNPTGKCGQHSPDNPHTARCAETPVHDDISSPGAIKQFYPCWPYKRRSSEQVHQKKDTEQYLVMPGRDETGHLCKDTECYRKHPGSSVKTRSSEVQQSKKDVEKGRLIPGHDESGHVCPDLACLHRNPYHSRSLTLPGHDESGHLCPDLACLHRNPFPHRSIETPSSESQQKNNDLETSHLVLAPPTAKITMKSENQDTEEYVTTPDLVHQVHEGHGEDRRKRPASHHFRGSPFCRRNPHQCRMKDNVVPKFRAAAVTGHTFNHTNATIDHNITAHGAVSGTPVNTRCSPKNGTENKECEFRGSVILFAMLAVMGICGFLLLLTLLLARWRRKQSSPPLPYTDKNGLTPVFSVYESPTYGRSATSGMRRIDEDDESNSVRRYTTLDGASDGWTGWIQKQIRGEKHTKVRCFSPTPAARAPRIPTLRLPKPTLATMRKVSGLSLEGKQTLKGKGKDPRVKWCSTV